MQSPQDNQQRRPMQTAHKARERVHRHAPRYIMPGLPSTVGQTFRAPRPMRATTTLLAEETNLGKELDRSCLFHDLYDKADGLNQRLQALERSVEAQRESICAFRQYMAERRVA